MARGYPGLQSTIIVQESFWSAIEHSRIDSSQGADIAEYKAVIAATKVFVLNSTPRMSDTVLIATPT